MGMLIGLMGLVGAFILGLGGAIIGWKKGKEKDKKFLYILLGFVIGAVVGFAAGFGLGLLFFMSQHP